MPPDGPTLRQSLAESIDPSSFVDPHGFVFHRDNQVFRAIHQSSTDFYHRMLTDGTAQYLHEHFGLVETEVSALPPEEVGCALVLRHERIEPATYCVEWCPSMLRDAARLHLELSLELVSREMMLQDAYPWNVRFRGTRPIFIDFTSIVEADSRLLWPAYGQFQSFFLRPLTLATLGKGKLGRALLLDNINGISSEDFLRIAGTLYLLRHPGLILSAVVERSLQQRTGLRRGVKRAAAKSMPLPEKRLRSRFFRSLLKQVDGMRLKDSGDPWKDYYAGIDPRVDKECKVSLLRRLLEQVAPSTVLDLGCNTGAFSVVAAQAGAEVIALDTSEACVERLYAYAKAEGLHIQPLVADVLCPTPSFGFAGKQYPALIERIRSHTVLCLGLMHHLHIAGRQSFERVAYLLSELGTHCAIFEYVGPDDSNIDLLEIRRPIAYTLDTVLAALRQYFSALTVFDSDRPTRKIVLCTRG